MVLENKSVRCSSILGGQEFRPNPYLISDLERRMGTANIFDWINNTAEQLAYHGTTSTGFIEFTDSMMRTQGVFAIHSIGDLVEDACISPSENQYVIYYRDGLPASPRRFAIAHEFGHVCWFAPGGGGQPLSPIQQRFGTDQCIEYLCNKFAAALLLPRQQFLILLAKNGFPDKWASPPLHLIPDLAEQFQVSEQVVARRLFFDLFSSQYALVCLRRVESGSTLPFDKNDSWKDRWETKWCVIPPELTDAQTIVGYSLPINRSGRVIPQDMLPKVDKVQTQEVLLDGRWWDVIKAQPKRDARRTFRRRPLQNARPGYVCYLNDHQYIAFSLTS